jgi:uncharacterized membrane protein YhaH (DUF805 family)
MGTMPDSTKKQFWFPAKRYGWGWGLPCAAQGWVVLVAFVLSITATCILLLHHPVVRVCIQVVLATILIVICLLKGEKPRWRWGKDS